MDIHLIILAIVASLLGCAHPPPREWWPSTQLKMMSECRVMCRNEVASYESEIGKCECGGKQR